MVQGMGRYGFHGFSDAFWMGELVRTTAAEAAQARLKRLDAQGKFHTEGEQEGAA
jgi:hypothetical protein